MAEPERKRRLPLLQPGGPSSGGGERTAWQSALWGSGGTLLVFVPLAALAQSLVQSVLDSRLSGEDALATAAAFEQLAPGDRLLVRAVMVGAPLGALAIAALAGGVLVGRWGGRGGKREAALGGAGAGLLAALMGASAYLDQGQVLTWAVTTLLIVGVAAVAAIAGAALGLRWRRAAK